MIWTHCPALLVLPSSLIAATPLAAAEGELLVGNPWLSLPIYDEAPRVYLVLQNPGAKPKRLVAATSSRCRSIELRIATVEGGAETSKTLDELEIPATGAVALSPRGYFLELVGAEALDEGERVPIELEFSDGTKIRFEAEARDE